MFEVLKDRFVSNGWSKPLFLLTIVIVVLLAGYVLNSFDFESFFKQFNFSAADDASWLNGRFAFLVFAALIVSVGCPRQVISFFAGYFFGLWQGIVIGVIATTLACTLSFFFARIFQSYFKGMLKGKLELAFDFWKANTFQATMIWRFIPAGSNLLTNLVAGAFGIAAVPFIAGSALGYIPHTVVFALLGAGIDVGSNFQLVMSGLLLVVSVGLGGLLYRKYQSRLAK